MEMWIFCVNVDQEAGRVERLRVKVFSDRDLRAEGVREIVC